MAALEGMRILDLSQYEAGPSATQALAWLGADVVKVERPGVGDPGRFGAGGLDSAYFHHWNANKRSVALDLGSDEGRRLLLELVPRFDVMVENFGPGVIEKLGLGYEDIMTVHPKIIYATVKGFGGSGPYSDFKCFDSVAMAMAGAFSVTGDTAGPPLPPGPTMGDVGTGMQLALAITAAYVQKLRTGDGQHIELAMQEAMTYYMRTRLAMGSQWGTKAAPRAGTGRGALLNLYPCQPFGPNDYIYLMAVTEGMWQALGAAMGRPELAGDPRFASASDRNANAERAPGRDRGVHPDGDQTRDHADAGRCGHSLWRGARHRRAAQRPAPDVAGVRAGGGSPRTRLRQGPGVAGENVGERGALRCRAAAGRAHR